MCGVLAFFSAAFSCDVCAGQEARKIARDRIRASRKHEIYAELAKDLGCLVRRSSGFDSFDAALKVVFFASIRPVNCALQCNNFVRFVLRTSLMLDGPTLRGRIAKVKN